MGEMVVGGVVQTVGLEYRGHDPCFSHREGFAVDHLARPGGTTRHDWRRNAGGGDPNPDASRAVGCTGNGGLRALRRDPLEVHCHACRIEPSDRFGWQSRIGNDEGAICEPRSLDAKTPKGTWALNVPWGQGRSAGHYFVPASQSG